MKKGGNEMRLSKMAKKIIAVTMAAAVVVSGIVFLPDKTIKAADLEPQVKVLGATILEEAAEDQSQSMRLAIQVSNASYADMCGIEVGVEGSTKEPVLISTDNEQQRKIYSRHDNLDIVVYTVVVKNIPAAYFDRKISFRGVVRKSGETGNEYTAATDMAERTVEGVKAAIESLEPIAEKQVNIAESNLAYSQTKTFTDNGDGTVTIELSRDSGGLSVGYYINDNKSPINLNDYSKMVLNVTSDAAGTGTYSVGFSGPYVDSSYWTNNGLKTALGYGIAFTEGTHDYTFTSDKWNNWDASKKIQSAVYIQAQGDSSGESNTFTLNSITLYKNKDAEKENPDATAAPIPTPEPTPEPTDVPEVTERPAPPAAEEPVGEGWQKVDLTGISVNNDTSYISDSKSLVMHGADYVEIPLNKEYDKSQIIKVYITGISYENNQVFRMWSGGRWSSRTSDVVSNNTGGSGAAFTREVTLNPSDSPEAETFKQLVICANSGAQITDLEITSLYFKEITEKPKPTLAPGEIDLSTCRQGTGAAGSYDIETGKVVINDTGDSEYYFDLPETIVSGETAAITVKGTYTGTHGFRVWIGSGGNSHVEQVQVLNHNEFESGSEFEKTFDLTANDECAKLTVKNLQTWAGGGPIDGLVINQIIVTKK